MRVKVAGRREFLIGASAAAAVAFLLGELSGAGAQAQDKPAAAPTIDEFLKKILGDAKPSEGKISLEIPEIAENGNTVPFTLAVESPMSDKDYVKAIHIFATANPQLDVATFRFTPMSGKASVSSRMRLAKTQELVALAELGDGRFLLSRRTVKVTIGGCGG
jgi:sulfur-oxidizing protein SoxY